MEEHDCAGVKYIIFVALSGYKLHSPVSGSLRTVRTNYSRIFGDVNIPNEG